MHNSIFSITEINEYIRSILDSDQLLLNIAVRGEISNYKLYPSGHHYFTLKDNGATLKCVMFKGSAFRLRFRPQNGMNVIALGKISVYPRDGVYQLYCNALSEDGVGDLYAKFEQLKAKLSAMNLFDSAHKKEIPKYPARIGLITSSAGAALHDMLRILKARFPVSQVKLIPVRVQGAEAPGEICEAIDFANRFSLADVLIVGRGGGSIEDLWAFNDEQVALAIYRSQIPIISAVGHEPDVTISDYVADLRAATPSNAAELVVPDQDNIYQMLDQYFSSMLSALNHKIKEGERRLKLLSSSPVMKDPFAYFDLRASKIDDLKSKLTQSMELKVERMQLHVARLASTLDAMSPLKVLARGYAVAKNEEGNIIRKTTDAAIGDQIQIQLSDGCIHATVDTIEEASV